MSSGSMIIRRGWWRSCVLWIEGETDSFIWVFTGEAVRLR